MIHIQMAPVEWQLVRSEALRRSRVLIKRWKDNRRSSGRSDAAVICIGLAGEYAFAKHFTLKLNLSTERRDDAPDFVMNGLKIDVKTRYDRPGGDMFSARLDKADVFVMAEFFPEPRRVTLVGWTTRDDGVFKPFEHEKRFKNTPGYIALRGSLRSMSLLRDYVSRERPSLQALSPSSGPASGVSSMSRGLPQGKYTSRGPL